jgi:hypothetical protein
MCADGGLHVLSERDLHERWLDGTKDSLGRVAALVERAVS